jgi:hypothetical protein
MTTPHDEMRWYVARRDLAAAMYQLSQEVRLSPKKKVRLMSITGASHLSSSIRDLIAEAKARINDAHLRVGGAVDNITSAASEAAKIADAINKEADALISGLGQFSNGGPPLNDPTPTPTPTPLPPMEPINPVPGPQLAPGTLMGTIMPTGEPKKNEGSL